MIMTAISTILIYAKDPNVSENYSRTCLKQPLKRPNYGPLCLVFGMLKHLFIVAL